MTPNAAIKPILFALAGLFALLALAVGAFIVFFPKDLAVREAVRQIELATGRELNIEGDVDVSIWPALGFTAEQVTLSNPEGFSDEPFLAADAITFAVALMPLFRGDVEVERFIMDGADIRLVASPEGAVNWAFPTEAEGEEKASIEDLRLDDVRLVNSRLSFIGGEAAPLQIEALDATLGVQSLDEPARLESAFDYLGERVRANFDIAAPRAMLEQTITPLQAEIRADALKADFEGQFDAATGVFNGTADASGDSLRALLAWIGAPLAEGGGFARFSGQGAIHIEGPHIDLHDSDFALDAIRAHGDVRVTTLEDGRLRAVGALNLPSLDLNPYLPAPAQGGEVGGVEVDMAWSADRLDLSGLSAIDADLDLVIGALQFQRLSFSDAALRLRIANGAADARLSRVSLYGGSGSARLIADGRAATPRIAVELSADNVDAGALLQNAIGFDKIQGTGRVTAALVGQGNSQAAIMRTLQGDAGLVLRNGAWTGINLGQVARTIQSLRAGERPGGDSAETDFAEMSANFQLANGVAATEDVRLLNPFVRLEGQGLINVGEQSIDMRLEPRAVRSAQGQGGATDVAGIGVPFRISGPWSAPSYRPEIGQAVRNELRDQVERAIADRDEDDPLRVLGESLFGVSSNPSQSQSETATNQQSPSPDAPEQQAEEMPAQTQEPPTPEERLRDALGDILNRDKD